MPSYTQLREVKFREFTTAELAAEWPDPPSNLVVFNTTNERLEIFKEEEWQAFIEDPDAEDIIYTPGVLTDWDGDADPGDLDDALDQLAERVDDDEAKLAGIAAGADVTGDNAPKAHKASHTDGTDDIQDATAGQKGVATAAQITKLDAIEAAADVTDATNVNAAGATMNTDTDVSANGYVLDEDNMASDDATKVPTQQSTKAYVDALKLDDLQAPDDNTDLDASTTKHGLLAKLTAPAANVLNLLGIGNGETAVTVKSRPLYDEVTMTIPNPEAGDDFTIRTFKLATTMHEISSVIVAGTNVVFNLYHGTDRSAAGTKALTADVTETSKTTGTVTGGGSWADATMVAGAHLRCKITSVTGAVTELSVTVRYYLT